MKTYVIYLMVVTLVSEISIGFWEIKSYNFGWIMFNRNGMFVNMFKKSRKLMKQDYFCKKSPWFPPFFFKTVGHYFMCCFISSWHLQFFSSEQKFSRIVQSFHFHSIIPFLKLGSYWLCSNPQEQMLMLKKSWIFLWKDQHFLKLFKNTCGNINWTWWFIYF